MTFCFFYTYYNRRNGPLDVVFYGDGTTQAWTGRMAPGQRFQRDGTAIAKIFNQTFHKDEGGKIEGIALGIGGDSVRKKNPQ